MPGLRLQGGKPSWARVALYTTMEIQLDLNIRDVQRNLRRFNEVEVREALAEGINKVAFEVIEAEKSHTKGVFEFAGAPTREWMSGKGSFRFSPAASSRRLQTTVRPRKSTHDRLVEHRLGSVIGPESDKRLRFKHEALAVPIKARHLRGPRGKIKKQHLPSAILYGDKGRGFVAGRAILERRGGQPAGQKRRAKNATWARAVVMYALVPSAKLAPRFEFYRTARDTAKRVWPAKAKDVFRKLAQRKQASMRRR